MAHQIKHRPESIGPAHNHKINSISTGIRGLHKLEKANEAPDSKGPYKGEDKNAWFPWEYGKSEIISISVFLLVAILLATAIWIIFM